MQEKKDWRQKNRRIKSKGEEMRSGLCKEGERKGGAVADFSFFFLLLLLPEGKSRQRNPKVQRGAVEPASVPGRPFPL